MILIILNILVIINYIIQFRDNLSYDFVLDADGGGFLSTEEQGYVYPRLIRMSFVFYPFESETAIWSANADSFTRRHFPYDTTLPAASDQQFHTVAVADAPDSGPVTQTAAAALNAALSSIS